MASGTTAEVKEVNKVGKHLPRGERCDLCLQQVMDSESRRWHDDDRNLRPVGLCARISSQMAPKEDSMDTFRAHTVVVINIIWSSKLSCRS